VHGANVDLSSTKARRNKDANWCLGSFEPLRLIEFGRLYYESVQKKGDYSYLLKVILPLYEKSHVFIPILSALKVQDVHF
jgi:hypothetical protein